MPVISVAQARAYAAQGGFTGDKISTIVAIAMAESGLNTTIDSSPNADGSIDRGIVQINSRAHPSVSVACAHDPLCSFQKAYVISSSGNNFNPWTTYTSGKYKQFLAQASVNTGQPVKPDVAQGTGNKFPYGQCTWWACERYHQLTGYWVPWTTNSNAYQWVDRAREFKWRVATSPPRGVPSIICLQGNAGQGVLSNLGHVAIVESVNPDGSVNTSNMNWSKGPGVKMDVTFRPGSGVTFIWAGDFASPTGSVIPGFGAGAGRDTYLPILDQVHQTLTNVPGFWGIALALDQVEQFPGWIDLTDQGVEWDVIGWIRSVGATITGNFAPTAVRGILISLGLFIMFVLILKVVTETTSTVAPIVASMV